MFNCPPCRIERPLTTVAVHQRLEFQCSIASRALCHNFLNLSAGREVNSILCVGRCRIWCFTRGVNHCSFHGPPIKKQRSIITNGASVAIFGLSARVPFSQFSLPKFVRHMAGADSVRPNRRRLRPMNLAVSITPRKRLRGKQSPPANYPEYPPVSPMRSPMQDCDLGAPSPSLHVV